MTEITPEEQKEIERKALKDTLCSGVKRVLYTIALFGGIFVLVTLWSMGETRYPILVPIGTAIIAGVFAAAFICLGLIVFFSAKLAYRERVRNYVYRKTAPTPEEIKEAAYKEGADPKRLECEQCIAAAMAAQIKTGCFFCHIAIARKGGNNGNN